MDPTAVRRRGLWVLFAGLLVAAPARGADGDGGELAKKAHAILKAYCYRCHGQDGALEGGMGYVLDRDKLIARRKVVPGQPDSSSLLKRVVSGKMPPPGEKPRPGADDVAALRQWIAAGAPRANPAPPPRASVSETDVYTFILADLEKMDRRTRRFQRYFSIAPFANAGLTDEELQTYRNALSLLLNSLSWHPRTTIPKPIDPGKTVLRIDLRDFTWDANLWNRLLAEYPYGVLHDTAAARAVAVFTATRLPVLRADWFIATASRPPLYFDLLQLPANLAELERQLRVDVGLNIQQERVARAGFNGSGVARNNRILERHDSVHGAYWRTYDFEAVSQNLAERDLLLPDRRNVFAYPLGPGGGDNTFQHAGGEVIFSLPNGLHGFMLVNAVNNRVDKAPSQIVSDPKRPDRQVETGISCFSCHVQGINFKSDQIREHVAKNPKAFSRADAETVRALYPPEAKMKALMEEDAERYRKAVEKTGQRITPTSPIAALTLRYEADVDLPTAAAEVGLRPDEFLARLRRGEAAARNLGALKVAGGTVSRQVWVQAFADVLRDFRLGGAFQPGQVGQRLPDNTGETDPLEAQSSPANAVAFSPDGRLALFASADKSVRLWDMDGSRELRRFVGHTASVWSVAFSPDGKQALSGSADNTVRLWEVESGRELRRMEGHEGLVTCVAFSPDGKHALSAGFDQTVYLWDLEKGREARHFDGLARYPNAVRFAPDGRRAVLCGEGSLVLLDTVTGKEVRRFEGHKGAVNDAALSADGRRLASCGDDKTIRLWDATTGKQLRSLDGGTFVKSVALSANGKRVLAGGADGTVRLWDADSGKELSLLGRHDEAAVCVAFAGDGALALSGSRDAAVRAWELSRPAETARPVTTVRPADPPRTTVNGELKPTAVLSVGGTVSHLFLSPDGKWLYYFNLTDGKLGRVESASLKRDREARLAPGTEALAMPPDGKWLYAVAAEARKGEGRVQVLDPKTLEVRKAFAIPTAPYDIAAANGGLLFVSGAAADWSDVAVIDARKGAVAARWGGVWTGSLLRLSPDGRRLYVSTQGVSPGQIDVLAVPTKLDDRPVPYTTPARGKHPLGGGFVVSPDGKYLLCKTGTVLRLSANRDEDLRHAATVAAFAAAAVEPELHAAFVLAGDGTLKHYSYPDFKLQASYRLALVGQQAVVDGKAGRLYVAGIDPRSVAEQPRAKAFGDLHAYDLKDLARSSRRDPP